MRTYRPDHAAHDDVLVASLVARAQDLEPEEQAAARALVERCVECAALHADLVALSGVAAAMPTPVRPRDFTLTSEDAARLRHAGLRGLFRRIGSARDAVTRPLAVGLTTFGIIGMLVGSVPGAFPMGASGGAAAQAPEAAGGAAAASADTSLESLEIDEPALPSEDDGGLFQGTDQGDSQRTAGPDTGIAAAPAPTELAVRDDPTGLSVLFVLAGVMTIAGFGLFALRWTARRL
jgi:hypothetical protein